MGEIYGIHVTTANGERILLERYAGKTLLIVNVASHCVHTPQYIGLQRLYEQYRSLGLEVLGFPCNDFGMQEPNSIEEIMEFCLSKFGIRFDMFDKIHAAGENKHPLYTELTLHSQFPGEVKWNFEKFIVSRDGGVIARFPSNMPPEALELKQVLEQDLYKAYA